MSATALERLPTFSSSAAFDAPVRPALPKTVPSAVSAWPTPALAVLMVGAALLVGLALASLVDWGHAVAGAWLSGQFSHLLDHHAE